MVFFSERLVSSPWVLGHPPHWFLYILTLLIIGILTVLFWCLTVMPILPSLTLWSSWPLCRTLLLLPASWSLVPSTSTPHPRSACATWEAVIHYEESRGANTAWAHLPTLPNLSPSEWEPLRSPHCSGWSLMWRNQGTEKWKLVLNNREQNRSNYLRLNQRTRTLKP